MNVLISLIIALVASAAHAAPGDLDTTFGSGTGRVLTGFGPVSYDPAYSSAVQADGRLVVAGYTFASVPSGPRQFVVVRYNTDGSLDSTFASGGKFILTIQNWPPTSWDGAGVHVLPNGKILGAGLAGARNFVLVRLTSSGALDTSFGTLGTGVVVTSLAYLSASYAEYKFKGFAVSAEAGLTHQNH